MVLTEELSLIFLQFSVEEEESVIETEATTTDEVRNKCLLFLIGLF